MNSIVLGIAPGEMSKPYSPLIPKRVRKRILKLIRKKSPRQFGTAQESFDYIDQLKSDEIEINGVWLDSCIASAVIYSLRRDLIVKVPKKTSYRDKSSRFDPLTKTENPSLEIIVQTLNQYNLDYQYSENQTSYLFKPQ